MALITITYTYPTVNRNAGDALRNPLFQSFITSIRAKASDALRAVPALRVTESIDNFYVTYGFSEESPITDVFGDPDDKVGKMTVDVCIVVADEIGYDYRSPDGPVKEFAVALQYGFSDVFDATPEIADVLQNEIGQENLADTNYKLAVKFVAPAPPITRD